MGGLPPFLERTVPNQSCMRSYYTVIYVQINAIAQDRLAIGMIMVEPEAGVACCDYSTRKLNIIDQLVKPGTQTGIKWSLVNYKAFFGDHEQQGNLEQTGNLARSSKAFYLSEHYLRRLAIYQQNVVQFGNPTGIDLPCSEEVSRFLYEEQIDDVPDSGAATKAPPRT